MIKNRKGFTLIELLVTVLILGIIAAVATQHYNKALERSRLMEAVVFLRHIAQSQQRRYMNTGRFAERFSGLDTNFRGAAGPTFYTKGNPETGADGNGFKITLSGSNWTDGIAAAVRSASANAFLVPFAYQVERYYLNGATACRSTPGAPAYAAANGSSLCADFCGIDWLETGNWCCDDGSSENGGSATLTGGCQQPSANAQEAGSGGTGFPGDAGSGE